MKKFSLIILSALMLLITANTAKAQVGVGLSVHIGTPPVWAPAAYAHSARYYYIPEMDCYYDAVRGGYFYNNGSSWDFSVGVPFGFHDYDVAHFHHVFVNYYGARPYAYFGTRRYAYVQQYHGGRGYFHQAAYRGGFDHGHFDHGMHGGRGNEWHGGEDHRGDRGHGGGDHGGGDRGHGGGDHGHGGGDHGGGHHGR